MKLDRYELKVGQRLSTFEFVSEGPKGNVLKLIQFTLIDNNDVYNLAFGDKNMGTGEIDDLAITNNGDSQKVLATIVTAVFLFIQLHPKAWIYATGSTKARTRLYRIGINKYFDEVMNDFEIFGQLESEWERYIKGNDYTAFVVQQKSD